MSIVRTDVAIIGGGYYGAFVANEIKAMNPLLDVTVVEKEDAPFTKASSTNQGQFHMGYMYSADKALAGECVENIARFSRSFGEGRRR
jgi:L-2-hydroxyglutarate oxidase LhgO